MFEVMSPENSQRITLNDNAGRAAPATWDIGVGVKAIAWAVLSYAKQNGIAPQDVGYSVKVGG